MPHDANKFHSDNMIPHTKQPTKALWEPSAARRQVTSTDVMSSTRNPPNSHAKF